MFVSTYMFHIETLFVLLDEYSLYICHLFCVHGHTHHGMNVTLFLPSLLHQCFYHTTSETHFHHLVFVGFLPLLCEGELSTMHGMAAVFLSGCHSCYSTNSVKVPTHLILYSTHY